MPLTFHELTTVCLSRRVEQWDHTSVLSAHFLSCFVKKPPQPSQLNPYRIDEPDFDDPEEEYRKLKRNESRNGKAGEVSNNRSITDQMGTAEVEACDP